MKSSDAESDIPIPMYQLERLRPAKLKLLKRNENNKNVIMFHNCSYLKGSPPRKK